VRPGEQRVERRRRGSPAENFFDVENTIPTRLLFQPQPQLVLASYALPESAPRGIDPPRSMRLASTLTFPL